MKSRVISGLTAGVLLFAACGKDTPTKAEFITKGDAICKKANTTMDPLFEKLFAGSGPDPAKIKEIVPKIAAEVRSLTNQLDDLSGPADGKKVVDAAVKEIDQALIGVDAAVAEAKKGNEDAGKKLFASFSHFEAADKGTRAYGFKVCGAEDNGDGETKAPADLPADQKAFVAQGDDICKAASETIEPVFGDLFGSANLAKKAEALAKLVPLVQAQNDALKALTPPAAIEAKFKEITQAYDANLTQAREAQAAAAAGDKAKFDSMFEKLNKSFEEPDKAFKTLGFKDCGH